MRMLNQEKTELPSTLMERLLKMQSSTAQLVTRPGKREPITPVLKTMSQIRCLA